MIFFGISIMGREREKACPLVVLFNLVYKSLFDFTKMHAVALLLLLLALLFVSTW